MRMNKSCKYQAKKSNNLASDCYGIVEAKHWKEGCSRNFSKY